MKLFLLLIFSFFGFFCSGTKEQEVNPLVLLSLPEMEQSKGGPGLCKTTESNGIYTTEVNAKQYYTWTYCSLSQNGISTEKTENWELSFKRFKIGTNSGVSGDGKSGACPTDSTDFSSVTKTSCTNFTIDTKIETSVNRGAGLKKQTEEGNEILKDWYDYNISTHILTTKKKVYLIRSGDGKTFFKIQILDYYDKAGTSGYITFKWSKI